jgi:hypothetical protein
MDSLQIEEKHDTTVVTKPENAHTVFNSKTQKFHRFKTWNETADAYHIRLKSNKILTVRKYKHPSNKYYLTRNSQLAKNQ